MAIKKIAEVENSEETNVNQSANIESASTGEGVTNAEGSSSEDTLDLYKSLIEEMKAQNSALMEQNKSLQAQFATLIRNGASVASSPETSNESGTEDKEPYTYLKDLGLEIGKRDYKSHNMKDGDRE